MSAAEVPELLLTLDGSEAALSGSGAMGWVPPLPSASSELSMKKR